MRLRRLIPAVVAAVALPAVLLGTGITSASASKSYTVALLNGNNIDPYFLSIWKGALNEAGIHHVKMVEDAPATFDPEEQVPLMDDLIAKHVNAIILSADGLQPLLAPMQKAYDAHIPIIIVNESESDMNNTKYAKSFITSGNPQLGEAAGVAMAGLLHDTGQVAVIDSVAGLTADLARGVGFTKEAKAKGLAPESPQFSNDVVSTADSITTDLIDSQPNLKGIFAIDSLTSQGVGTAIKALGKTGDIKVVGIDAEPQEVTFLKEGVMQALIAQKPYYVGQLAMKYAVDALTGKSSKIVRNVNPGDVVLTPSNINKPANKDVPYSATAP